VGDSFWLLMYGFDQYELRLSQICIIIEAINVQLTLA
jgi:hypothetical protein